MLLKIGDKVINTDAIAYVNLEHQQTCDSPTAKKGDIGVAIVFQGIDGNSSGATHPIVLRFFGEEADSLRQYFSSRRNVVDLTPGVEKEDPDRLPVF